MKIGKLELKITNNHFIANDGCKQNLEESPIQLRRNEDIVLEHNVLMMPGTGNPTPRIKNLLYFNIVTAELFFMCYQELPVKCPVCEEVYVIKKQDYDSLKNSS